MECFPLCTPHQTWCVCHYTPRGGHASWTPLPQQSSASSGSNESCQLLNRNRGQFLSRSELEPSGSEIGGLKSPFLCEYGTHILLYHV